jgi:hypothetical protein
MSDEKLIKRNLILNNYYYTSIDYLINNFEL